MTTKTKDENIKPKVIALLESGYHERDIVELMKVKAPTIKKIKKEWDEKQNNQHIANLAAKNEVAVLSGESVLQDTIEVLKLPEEMKQELMDQVDDLTEGLKGLSILNSTLQVAAIKLTQTIIKAANVEATAAEVLQLSGALAKLNDTFFNPNNTNINILNQEGGETNVNGGAFSQYMKD